MMIRAAASHEAEILGGMRWDWTAEESARTLPDKSEFVKLFADWARAHAISHLPYLAFVDDEPVAMAWLVLVPRPPGPADTHRVGGDLQSVYVVPQRRGQGIGNRLIATVIAEARARGLENLSVRSGTRSQPFYHRIGFAKVDRLLDYPLAT